MIAQTMSTMMVSLMASCRVGQTTFLSSAITSPKNLILDVAFLAMLVLAMVADYLVSRWTVWVRQRGQYLLSSRRCGSFFLFLVVV